MLSTQTLFSEILFTWIITLQKFDRSLYLKLWYQLLGNTWSNYAVNQNLWGREKSAHTKLLTEFGQCCIRLQTCYRSFIIIQGNFTSSQLTLRSQIHSEITRNFLKKIFCKNFFFLFFFSSLVLSLFSCFGMILNNRETSCIYRRAYESLVKSCCWQSGQTFPFWLCYHYVST